MNKFKLQSFGISERNRTEEEIDKVIQIAQRRFKKIKLGIAEQLFKKKTRFLYKIRIYSRNDYQQFLPLRLGLAAIPGYLAYQNTHSQGREFHNMIVGEVFEHMAAYSSYHDKIIL